MTRRLLAFIFTAMMLAMCPAAAQNLKFDIVKFELNQLDGTASNKNYEKIDGSGNKYAIIKVRSTDGDEGLSEFMFNFNSLKSIVEDKGDELWVYVQKNAKMVTISREGYTPLRNFDLKMTLQAGKTYNMEITYDRVEKVVKKELRMQMLSFKLTPAVESAMVVYKKQGDDKFEKLGITDKNGEVAINLNFGVYEYQVMAQNYFTSQGIIKLNSSTEVHTENITLKPNFSNITLKTASGADIYINNELKGRGSWTGALNAGDYVVECKQESHRPTSQTITVVPNADKAIELLKPTPITGFASVISNPSGATVMIDGVNCGTTPCNIKDILVGTHEMTVSKIGYSSKTTNIEIKEGECTEKSFELSNLVTATITSTPVANLYIDGKYKGHTQYTEELPYGKHTIELQSNGYKKHKKEVTFTPENLRYHANLKRTFSRKIKDIDMPDTEIEDLFYFEGGYRHNNGGMIGFGFGGFISNFNLQAEIFAGMYESSFDTDLTPYQYTLKFGYGLGFGDDQWFMLTPQLCLGYYTESESSDEYSDESYSSVTLGCALRMDIHLSSSWGISVTPEYSVYSSQDYEEEGYEEETSFKSHTTGFKINVGINWFIK